MLQAVHWAGVEHAAQLEGQATYTVEQVTYKHLPRYGLQVQGKDLTFLLFFNLLYEKQLKLLKFK